MSDMELYARYFPPGKKVGVGIPLPNADVFKDWAIIHEIDEDLVSLQLSRDVLPVDVLLHYGQILELRGGSENNGYCCRAIVVSEGYSSELLLRLIGEIVSDELREFYRIDAFLPVKYYVSREQNINRLHTEWEVRREERLQRETERRENSWKWEFGPLPEKKSGHSEQDEQAVAEPETGECSLEDDDVNSWDSVIPLAANISGGGLRIVAHYGFEDGDYVLLEIMVPSPRRIVDVIGRIVFANRNYAAGSDREYFNTGIQFVYIDERDRDAIVKYISTIQLKRIKQLREKYLYRGAADLMERAVVAAGPGARNRVTQGIAFIVCAVIIGLLINYFWYYAHEHPKGEIQRTFEEGVKKYRGQIRQE